MYDEITAVFSQENDGQYFIVLYRKNSDGTLDRKAYSAYSGTFQKLTYMCMRGDVYYLQVLPVTAPTTSYNYTFGVYQTYNNYTDEPNELYDTAYPIKDTINMSGRISNPFDEDWYKFTVSKQRDYDITARYYTNTSLALYIYDSDLNAIGSFYIDNGTRAAVLDAGVYYFRVVGMSGHYSSNPYHLKVLDYVPGIPTYTFPLQHYESDLIVNEPVMLFEYFDFEPGTRIDFEMSYTLSNPTYDQSALLVPGLSVPRFYEDFEEYSPIGIAEYFEEYSSTGIDEYFESNVLRLPYDSFNSVTGRFEVIPAGELNLKLIVFNELDAAMKFRFLPPLE